MTERVAPLRQDRSRTQQHKTTTKALVGWPIPGPIGPHPHQTQTTSAAADWQVTGFPFKPQTEKKSSAEQAEPFKARRELTGR